MRIMRAAITLSAVLKPKAAPPTRASETCLQAPPFSAKRLSQVPITTGSRRSTAALADCQLTQMLHPYERVEPKLLLALCQAWNLADAGREIVDLIDLFEPDIQHVNTT